MFGRKQRRIEKQLRTKQIEDFLMGWDVFIEQGIRENMELREQMERKHDIHNAFAMVQDHLLKLSEELRQDGSKIVYREKHKTAEKNFFVSETPRTASDIENIVRALYEIEKSEEVR